MTVEYVDKVRLYCLSYQTPIQVSLKIIIHKSDDNNGVWFSDIELDRKKFNSVQRGL